MSKKVEKTCSFLNSLILWTSSTSPPSNRSILIQLRFDGLYLAHLKFFQKTLYKSDKYTKIATKPMVHIIKETKQGKVFKCSSCNKIHIEFGNLNFNFSEYQYKIFSEYISNLDGDFYEKHNARSFLTRKIRIPLGSSGFCFLLSGDELKQLKNGC